MTINILNLEALFDQSLVKASSSRIEDIDQFLADKSDALKQLGEEIKFWNEQFSKTLEQNQAEINSSIIKNTLIAIANYLDEMFLSDESVKELTIKMLREDDSPFYFSIKNFTDKNLIELMQKYLNHVLEIAKFIEESGQENKDKNLEKIKTNLEIFPSKGNIDFICLDGSIERLGMAEDNLRSIEFHQQIIKKTIQKKATELLEQINQGNKVHIQSFLKSLLSFIRPNDSMFRTPDSQIELKKILDFQRTFKEEVFKNIDKELDEYCDDILQSSNYEIIVSYIKIFESQLGIKLDFYDFFTQGEECFVGFSNEINSQAFKSKEEIKEIFENKLKEQFPAIYCDDRESQKDAFDYLAELDIYSSESKVFLDPDKMDALLNLLFPSAEEPYNSTQKIKAGLLFLHSLARNFKDSDPVFFLVFLDKMKDRFGEKVLDKIYRNLPDELKKHEYNFLDILDYIAIGKISKSRENFSRIDYEIYKELYLNKNFSNINFRDIEVFMMREYIDFMFNNNHFTLVKQGLIQKGISIDYLVRFAILDKKSDFLKELIEDDQLQIGGSPITQDKIIITQDKINNILIYALNEEQKELILALLKKGADVNIIDPQTEKSLLQIAIEGSDDEIVLALLQKEADTEVIDQFGCSMLQCAIINGNIKTIKFLIEYGANVNAIDPSTNLPILYDVIKNGIAEDFGVLRDEVAIALIKKGADFNLIDPQTRKSLLQIEIERGDNKIVLACLEILIERGDDKIAFDIILEKINVLQNSQAPDSPESQALESFRQINFHDQDKLFGIIELMIDKGFDITENYPQDSQNHVLSVILKYGNKDRALRLYENFSSKIIEEESSNSPKENLDYKNQDGHSLLYLACLYDHVEIVRKILDENYSSDQNSNPNSKSSLMARISPSNSQKINLPKIDDETLELIPRLENQEIKKLFQEKGFIKDRACIPSGDVSATGARPEAKTSSKQLT